MQLIDRLKAIADRIPTIRDQLETEEATKNALIMPFIQALGYNVFDPNEVVPEFTADVGIKRGEKVDYAILVSGVPAILVECKRCGASLDSYSSQLFRYFTTTQARIAILTDGIQYRFYTDLRHPNKMDDKPFMELNMLEMREPIVQELGRLAKETLNLEEMLDSASDLKYSSEIKQLLAAEMDAPSDGFVRFIADKVYDGRLMQNVIDRFRPVVKKSLSEFVTNLVDRRLKAALLTNKAEEEPDEDEAGAGDQWADAPDIETTAQEFSSLYIVKAILGDAVPAERVVGRDVRTYFGILLDDNNRKPICRLWLNGSRKYLGLFDENKTENKVPIEVPEDIFAHADALHRSLEHALARS